MGTAAYRLKKVFGGILHYAEVTATAEFGGGHPVVVSTAAYACDEHRAAAMSGADFALRHVTGQEGMLEARVVIDRIQVVVADTSPADVEYAAAFAVWKALGVDGSKQPALFN